MKFKPVIGLEVHAQLKTRTKIFCGCSTQFGQSPNANTCPVCTGMPGMLPVLNKQAVSYAIKAALATNCSINKESRFDRKNYFYPDLPKGYQISQYALPIAEHGFLDIGNPDSENRAEKNSNMENLKKDSIIIGITRIHMEEDAGKLIHDPARHRSMVDLNRTGVPLIEIVSEPDIRTAAQAGAYLRKLHTIVKYIDVCDGNMEQGSFRCDANISLRPVGQKAFGTRTELKNLNSFKNVEKAISYEIERQKYVLEEGKKVIQETRLWDPSKNKTFSMRGKEEAHDYRYFPDPDLVPLIVDDEWIDEMAATLPELPDEKQARFIKEYNMKPYDASILTSQIELALFFEEAAAPLKEKRLAANMIITTLLGMLKTKGISIEESPVQASDFSKLLLLIENGRINTKTAKAVFEEMALTSKKPETIVAEKGLEQVSDLSELETMVDTIIAGNPEEVKAYRDGKTKLFSFFMGQIMKETRGKADPKIVTPLLKSKL